MRVDDIREGTHARHDARDTRARRTIMPDAFASAMRSAHKEAQSEAKSLPSRRERRVGTVRTGGFSGNESTISADPSVLRFPGRANGEHKRTTRASSSLRPPPPPPLLRPESEFYVLHTDENTCATARDTRVSFLGRLLVIFRVPL